jgi:hypothetical protein
VVDALKVRRERQETDRLAAGVELWEDWGLVLTTRFGTPLSPRNDYRDFRRLVGAAGLRRVRLHDLRHTAASLMLAQGVSPRVVMEILGHSQISVTMNTYSHVTPASSREAVEAPRMRGLETPLSREAERHAKSVSRRRRTGCCIGLIDQARPWGVRRRRAQLRVAMSRPRGTPWRVCSVFIRVCSPELAGLPNSFCVKVTTQGTDTTLWK